VGDLTKNFSRHEFACKDNCGFDDIDPRVVAMAQVIRNALGESIRINSGCRCEKRNKESNGVSGSYHTQGKAADLSTGVGSARLFQVIKQLHSSGMLPNLKYCKRYINSNFVHIDCGEKKRSSVFQEGN
jgi:uncharacterized protein YcbK (DUF882 family)